MRKTAFVFLLSLSFTVSYAQRKLEVKEKTEALSVFIDKDPVIDKDGGSQAGATISCPVNLNLTFSSNVDKVVDVYKSEEKGGLRFYYLRFIVGRYKGANYSNRILEVAAPGFVPLKFSLALTASQSKSFEIFDPNATVGVGCFYEFYNGGIELFKNALYSEAKEKYKLALECTDAPENINVKEKIANIDTILILRKKADEAYEMQNFKIALDCYEKINSYNADDQYVNKRMSESRIRYLDSCTSYYRNAEDYFVNGKYAQAKKLYEIIVLQSCPKATEANVRLSEIRQFEEDRKFKTKVVNYEYAQNTPLGISGGKYSENKVGSYISFRMNIDVIEAIRKKHENAEKPEANLSIGWSLKAVSPVWIFAGVGYTGVGRWETEGHPVDDPALKIQSAISPEAGVLGKIGPIVLRYTFQYRFSIDKDYQDLIGSMKHVFGVGICF